LSNRTTIKNPTLIVVDKRWLRYPYIFLFLKTIFFFNDIVEQIKTLIFMGGNVEKNISKIDMKPGLL